MTSESAGHRPRFSEGPRHARVMLVGQNPGREEVKQNRPFVGRAGKYLNKVLLKKGIDRAQLYLTSVVKEPTPANRKPTANEIKRWMPCLMSEIREVDPQIVVLMGRVAWETPRITQIEYMETYHPAAAMRFLKVREKFEKDMAMLRHKMKERSLL
jgi:uracil-DNA glycosylase